MANAPDSPSAEPTATQPVAAERPRGGATARLRAFDADARDDTPLDREASLWAETEDMVYRVAASQVTDYGQIKDVAQETLRKLLASRFDLARPANERKSYVWRTVESVIRDRARKERRQRTEPVGDLVLEIVDSGSPVDESALHYLETAQLIDWFVAAVNLPPAPRRVFKAFYLTGLGPTELAPLLGVTPNDISANLRRAKLRVRETINLTEAEYGAICRVRRNGLTAADEAAARSGMRRFREFLDAYARDRGHG
jgi:RNA polymerase sigma factor (sigma-70 family)